MRTQLRRWGRAPFTAPAMLLLFCFLGIFVLLHMRGLGWSPGPLHHQLEHYWDLITQLLSPEQIFSDRRGGNTEPVSFLMLAAVLIVGHIGWIWAILRARTAQIRLRTLLIWTALMGVPLLVLPNMFSGDIYSYIMFGRISAIHGENPFIAAPRTFNLDPFLNFVDWKDTPSVYGSVWILVSHVLTVVVEALGGTVWMYQFGYLLLALGLHLGSAALIWSILGRMLPQRQVQGTIMYAWSPLALLEFAGNAHNDILMIFLLLLGFWLHLRQRPYLALLALTGAVLVKWVALPLVLLYGLLVLRQAPRWGLRARLLLTGVPLALAAAALSYAPYWAGAATFDILVNGPPSKLMRNTIGELVLNEVQYSRSIQGLGPSPWLQVPVVPDETQLPKVPEDDELLREQIVERNRMRRAQMAEFRKQWTALHEQVSRDQQTWRLGHMAVLMLVCCYWAWRTRDEESLLRGWGWVLFTYIVSALWFWPWYVTWLVALAALSTNRRTIISTALLSIGAMLLYVLYIDAPEPPLMMRMRALIVFGPALLYVAGSMGLELWGKLRRTPAITPALDPLQPTT